MLVRFGVQLPPRKAELLDFIISCTRGRGGVSVEAIGWVFYPGISTQKQRDVIANHVCQINGLLAETDWRILSRGKIYRVQKK